MEEKLKLLKRHPCGDGLRQKTLRRIAEDCELVKLESGDCLHEATAPLDAMYLVVGGRLRVSTIDIHGKVVRQWFETSGGQFGAVAMTTDQTSNFHCVAEEPTTLVKIDRELFLRTTRNSYRFRLNVLHLLNDTMQQMLFQSRAPNRPRRIAFVHQSSETRSVTSKVIQRLCELGEQPAWLGDGVDKTASPGIRMQTIRPSGNSLTTADIETLIDRAPRKSTRIIVDVAGNLDASELIKLVKTVDQVVWVVTDQNWISSQQPLKTINQRSQALRDKINLLWVLPGDQTNAPQADELRPLISRDFKLSFCDSPPDCGNVLKHGLERLVHHLRGIQIGVALGGGAARGMAHLGVLKAFESNGIVVDMIAGTSAGAMTGTVYSAGLDVDYLIDRFVHDLRPGWFFRSIPKGDQWYLLHKYRRGQFDPMLRKYLGDATLKQLPVPMHAITVDLVEGRTVVRDNGDAVHSILESINLPGISLPINRDGRSLIDGGLMNNFSCGRVGFFRM